MGPYFKKGAKFSDYLQDEKALASFAALRKACAKDAALYTIDFAAAADPKSGRWLELYHDASNDAWGCTLAQRMVRGGMPRPCAVFSRSFTATERNWSTFERELFGMREALASTHYLTKGFPLLLYTDHKNNLFTASLMGCKRINKKLLKWSLDIEEFGDRIIRVWIKGTANILGDVPSRALIDREALAKLPMPMGPVKRVVEAMFHRPMELEAEVAEMDRFLNSLEDADPDLKAEESRGRREAVDIAEGERNSSIKSALTFSFTDSPSDSGAAQRPSADIRGASDGELPIKPVDAALLNRNGLTSVSDSLAVSNSTSPDIYMRC